MMSDKQATAMMKKSTKEHLLIACGFVACVATTAFTAGAAAQTAAAGNTNELRPLYADAGDVAEGKRLATSACASCHGAEGISTSPDVPNLAGQRAVYLYTELRAYQSGVRSDSAMHNAVKFLNDDALVKVAAYFASLEPAQPKPGSGAATKPDALQAGKDAAAACTGCHGEAGVTKTPGMPSLVGLDPKYFTDAINDYKNGKRKNELMKSMAAAISDANAKNIALYFALQKAEAAKTPAPGDAAAGKAAAASCGGCHGENGVSASPTTPSLAGQDAEYLTAALRAYKDGTRDNETMKGLASALDEKTIKNLAAYYAGQKPQAPNVRKPFTTQEWVERCERCHGLNGNSTNPRFPALAGQRADYLVKVLNGYRSGARKSSEMAAMAGGLSENDIDNLAAYFSSQKARSVMYIVLPGK
jgi:cytochrome c553